MAQLNTEQEVRDAENKLTQARSRMLIEDPFFGTLATRLQLVSKEAPEVKTGATDCKTKLFFNASWVSKQGHDELKGFVVHEIFHCIGKHQERIQDREPDLWNIACDLAINPIILDAGYALPKGALYDAKYIDWTPEAIYADLMDNNIQFKECPWGVSMQNLDNTSSEGQDEIEAVKQAGQEWASQAEMAQRVAKEAGKLSEKMSKTMADLLKPVVDWRTLLWPFMVSLRSDNFSWRKPNRAYIGEDEYLPSLYDEALGSMVFVKDVSGSISDRQRAQFWSEMQHVITTMNPAKVYIIQCDAEVVDVKEYEPSDLPSGFSSEQATDLASGGTDFEPAFEYINKNIDDIECVVYLTDLVCNSFGQEPNCPVLWVSTDEPYGTVPFGDVIIMHDDGVNRNAA